MKLQTELNKRELMRMIRQKTIVLGGNKALNIYGQLGCTSGKRMKKENRIFFESKQEAISAGYRPCGHCLKHEYLNWKNGIVS